MTQRAIFIEDHASNPQSGPYSMGVMDNMVRAIMGWPGDDAGVIAGAENGLASSTVGGSVRIASGYAHIHGMIYWNDANVDFTPTTPSVGTTRKRVVLRKEWDDPVSGSISVELALLEGTDGSTSLPSLTQTDGTRWEIPICYFDVSTGGAISNRTDDAVSLLSGPAGIISFSIVGTTVTTLAATSGVSVSRTGTGTYDIVFPTVVNYAQIGFTGYFSSNTLRIGDVSGYGTNTLTITVRLGGAASDSTSSIAFVTGYA